MPARTVGLVIGVGIMLAGAAVGEEDAARILQVAADGSGQYKSIQEAVDAVGEGALVKIAPGVYKEHVRISKPIVLKGAGWDQTTILSEKRVPGSQQEMLASLPAALLEELKAAKTNEERALVHEKVRKLLSNPVLKVSDVNGVEVRDVKIHLAGTPTEETMLSVAAVEFEKAGVVMRDCAVVGSPGDGIQVLGMSEVSIEDCLIAAVWSTGIMIGTRDGGIAAAVVEDCDIRNCHYAGMRIVEGCDVKVERCRVSGAAWHGIRYDDASPTITDSLIFKNARSGIYASGETASSIKGNIFYANEISGISCWSRNRDTITGNVFAKNLREGLAMINQADPLIKQNIFLGHPVAIVAGYGNSKSGGKMLTENRRLEKNIFWENEKLGSVRKPGMSEAEEIELSADSGNLTVNPMFENAEGLNFSLRKESPALKAGIGVKRHISFHSPWKLQPEELAMIPDTDTRDYRQWKR